MGDNTINTETCIDAAHKFETGGAIFSAESVNLESKAIEAATRGDYKTAGQYSSSAFTYSQISKIFFASSEQIMTACSLQIPAS